MGNLRFITKLEYEKLNIGQQDGFHITISCKYIQTWEQLAESLGNAFQFPMRNEGFDGTWDWMTDFSWSEIVNKKTISICFYDSKELFKYDQKLRTKVISFFESIVDHWKNASNLGYINGKKGEIKNVNVFLID